MSSNSKVLSVTLKTKDDRVVQVGEGEDAVTISIGKIQGKQARVMFISNGKAPINRMGAFWEDGRMINTFPIRKEHIENVGVEKRTFEYDDKDRKLAKIHELAEAFPGCNWARDIIEILTYG